METPNDQAPHRKGSQAAMIACFGCGTDYDDNPDGSAIHCPSCEAFLRRCTMRLSDKGLAELIAHEGVVLAPYKDSKGVWTFGIGHTASAGHPIPETMPRGVMQPLSLAVETFRKDVGRFEGRVRQALGTVDLEQHEFDALVSFDYNTGGIFQAQLTKELLRGDRKKAAIAFMGWSKPAEIIPRRRKEQALFRDGIYSNDGMATVYPADSQGRVLRSGAIYVSVAAILDGGDDPLPFEAPPVAATRWPAWFWRIFA